MININPDTIIVIIFLCFLYIFHFKRRFSKQKIKKLIFKNTKPLKIMILKCGKKFKQEK